MNETVESVSTTTEGPAAPFSVQGEARKGRNFLVCRARLEIYLTEEGSKALGVAGLAISHSLG